MARIVVLANSKRPDGQCIGGVDLDTGKWVRPVTASGDGIPVQNCFINGKFLALRDILEVDLSQPRQIAEFQCENRTIRNWNWRVTGRMRRADVQQYIEDATPILHSTSDRVAPDDLRRLSADQWKSLQLVRPNDLEFARHYYDPHRWVAEFKDADGNYYSLKITDPEATRRLEAGQTISPNSLLTISMAKPWTHDAAERPPLCYKIAAAVIEL